MLLDECGETNPTAASPADSHDGLTLCKGGATGQIGAIDRQHLARYTFGESSLEREILDLFCEQIVQLLDKLKSVRSHSDWAFATHSLKGCARAVGAWQVAGLAEQLERVAVAQSSDIPCLAGLDQAIADAVADARAPL